MSDTAWQEASARLCQHLISALPHGGQVLAYISIRNEPNLSPLFRARSDIRWGLPRCEGTALHWHWCCPEDPEQVQPGTYNIPEPLPTLPRIQPDGVDVMLVPTVACDRQGYRLGYGGGFYDRLLSQPGWSDRPTIGILFAAYCFPTLPHEPWDRPLSALCTEQGLVTPSALQPEGTV